MTKYVIDLPAETKVIVAKKQFLLNETDLMRIPVSQLELYIAPTVAEDAPVEKRVIELPADVIADLNEYKRARNSFNLFITTVGNSIPYFEYGLRLEDLSDWYLHPKLIEFVPKKEPMFVVEVDRHEYIYASFIGSAIGKKTVDFWKIPQEVTEEEADELVAGLTALNARKVKVDE